MMSRNAFIFFLAIAEAYYVFAGQSVRAETFSPPEVLFISAGPFIMGSDRAEREAAYRLDEKAYGHSATRTNRWYEGEKDRREEFTGTFAITKNPITNAEYAAFVSSNAHRPPMIDEETWARYGLIHPFGLTLKFSWDGPLPPKGREKHPVVLVGHADAVSYALWLSRKTGSVWRLPTEPEWEKAVRGTDGRHFPWGIILNLRT